MVSGGDNEQVRVQHPTAAVNVTLLALAADRRAAVDTDRKAAAPAADAPCSNRSGPTAANPPLLRHKMGQTDGRTDGHRIVTQILPYTTIDGTETKTNLTKYKR